MRHTLIIAWALALFAAAPSSGPALAQTEIDLNAFIQRVTELYQAGKTLRPAAIQYDFERKSGPLEGGGGATATTCAVVLTMINLPAPEVVNFRYMAMKGYNQVMLGFTIDVGDFIIRDGLPTGINPAGLQSAEFSASGFSSSGRMNRIQMDAGLLVVTDDPTTMSEFQRAFLTGRFSVYFTRSGGAPRGYVITEAVPASVFQQMQACVDNFPR